MISATPTEVAKLEEVTVQSWSIGLRIFLIFRSYRKVLLCVPGWLSWHPPASGFHVLGLKVSPRAPHPNSLLIIVLKTEFKTGMADNIFS